MNGIIYVVVFEKGVVGGIDDGIDGERSDVGMVYGNMVVERFRRGRDFGWF